MIRWEPGEKIVESYTYSDTGIVETNKWEVVCRGRIKVIQCTPEIGKYLAIGKEYQLTPHEPESYLELWSVDYQKEFDGSLPQILLYDWNDAPDATPGIELDQ